MNQFKFMCQFTYRRFYGDIFSYNYPVTENRPYKDLGPLNFSYYLNIFFNKSKSLHNKNYYNNLHFNYFFISKLFKNDYKNKICFFIIAGYVYDNLEHLSKCGICVVGKNFCNKVLKFSKSFNLLLTSTLLGLTVTIYITYFGTNTFGLII